MKIAPISYINSKSNYAQNKKNQPVEDPVNNINFTSANTVKGLTKTSAMKKMFAVFGMLPALNLFAQESKNLYNPDIVVKNVYKKPVGDKDKDYLEKAYVEEPQLFMALAQPKLDPRFRANYYEYSPAEIYGIIKVKQKNPVVAYELSKRLKSDKDGHLNELEQVLFVAEQMEQKKVNMFQKNGYNSSQDWYNNLKANDLNPPLNISLMHDYKNTDGARLNSAERLSIIEMYEQNPEFISKMLELSNVSIEDLYILEGEYENYAQRRAIDEFVDFLNENAKQIERNYGRGLNVPVSTKTVSALLDNYIVHPEAVKELCAQNIPVEHIQALAETYDNAPGLTLDSYVKFKSNLKDENNNYYFQSLTHLVQFLNRFVDIHEIIEQYDKFRGHMTFPESYNLVKAYDGKRENKEALSKIVNSSVIKIIDPKKLSDYVNYVKKNPEKELTKEIIKYAGDPMATYFGLS